MPLREVPLSTTWHGLNRIVAPQDLNPAESPDCTDCRNAGRLTGRLGPRLGRYRQSAHTYTLLGLGMLVSGYGRFKITADTNGDWTAAAVTWGGIAPAAPATASVSSMHASAAVRFVQFKDRVYGFNGRNRPQAFDGIRWRNMGILGGVDLPQFTPTVTYGGGTKYLSLAVLLTSVATFTTTTAHGFSTGQSVTIALTSGDTTYNGTWVIASTPSSTTFTVAITHGNIASAIVTGTATVAAGRGTSQAVVAANVATITTRGAHGFVTGQAVTFTNALYPYFSANSPFTIASTPSSTTFTIATVGVGNGTLYDLTPTSTSGMDCYVGSNPTAGITGTFYYVVVPTCATRFDGNGRGIEGIPSTVSAVAAPSNQSVVVGAIPTHSDPQVSHWNVYRTTNGGFDSRASVQDQDFFYLGRVTNGTATYTDTTADSSGWYKSATNFNRARFNQNIPPTCKGMVEYGNRLFAWGFDPIMGTVTVSNGSASVSAASVTLPNGIKGCSIRFAGENERYQIKSWDTGTTLTLDRTYEGALTTGAAFTIYRNKYEIWFSEFNDADAWGPDGEQRRNLLALPGDREITGCFPFQGTLLVFTTTEIWGVYGQGPNRFDIKKLTDAASVDAGAVSQDAILRVGNEVHFLSLDGPASISAAGQQIQVKFPGITLNTDWLDSLTATELALACAGTDGRSVWYSVPSAAAQTLNSKTFRFDRDTEGWFEETEMCPVRFIRQDGTDGQIGVLFYLQGKTVNRAAYGTVDLVVAGALSGTIDGAVTTTSFAMLGTNFYTSNGGMVEHYVRIYRAGVLLGTRRIISNDGLSVTWSSDATLPGSGTLVVAVGDTWEIGNIGWKWLTKTLEVPGHVERMMEAHATYTKGATNIFKTDIVDGTESTNVHKITCTNATADKWDVNQGCRTYAARLASRNGSIMRSLIVNQETEAGDV